MARATIYFTVRDVMDLFGFKDRETVSRLIRSGVLTVSGYSPRGAPLFSADELQRVGKQILPRPERPSAERSHR